jgi:hypothetical protein
MAVGFVAAAGFGQLESAPLARIAYWNQVLNLKCYEDSSWSSWVSSEANDVLFHNAVVKFTVVDEPHPYRQYEKNMALVDDEVTGYEMQAQLSFAEYSSIKIADLDMFRNAEGIDKFMSTYRMKQIAKYGETLNGRVLARYIAEAHPENQGTNAGFVTHSHNLGTSAVPVNLSNPADLAPFLARLQMVGLETKCFNNGEGWNMVFPSQILNVLYQSAFSNKLSLGACNSIVCDGVNGNIPGDESRPGLFGFSLWLNLGISVPNAAGAVPIVCFKSDAQIFASDQVISRVYERENFDKVSQELWVSGGRVLRSHQVIVAWVTV